MRKLILQTAFSVALIFALAVLAGVYFRNELATAGEGFVDSLGGTGLFLCYFGMDAFLLPIPQDPFAALALSGGLAFWDIVFWAGSGSIVGGCVGYGLGRLLSRNQGIQQRFQGRLEQGEGFMKRWGVAAVLIAGITPFPYTVVCWVSGALRMSFWRFLLASLAIRYVRVASYLWVIEKGIGV